MTPELLGCSVLLNYCDYHRKYIGQHLKSASSKDRTKRQAAIVKALIFVWEEEEQKYPTILEYSDFPKPLNILQLLTL